MSETLRYHSVAELRVLSLDELRALWELVPAERQRSYIAAYDRELKGAHAEGSDERDRRVALALLKRYEVAGLVPIGMRWARAPKRVQDAARLGELLKEPLVPIAATQAKPSRKLLALVSAMIVGMVALLVVRGVGTGDSETVTATATLPRGMTATPLALEAQDDIIESGDNSRTAMYPINLQMSLPTQTLPRVWVVQRRAVGASEWNYDPNPDTASFLNGMSVRPVIGIPWSEDNSAWFDQISSGAEFRLQMNTGAVMTFVFEEKRTIRRSDTDVFRQISPGLVLLLIGELDDGGMPTGTRSLIAGRYFVEQELGRFGELLGSLSVATSLPTVTPPTTVSAPGYLTGLDVQIISVTSQVGRITLQMRLYNNGAEPLTIEATNIWLALGYVESPVGPRIPAETLPMFNLLVGQAADIELVWNWSGEPFGTFGVGEWAFALRF
jgi:hypothetical protein